MLRVDVRQSKSINKEGFDQPIATYTFSYSTDGNAHFSFGEPFIACDGLWIGAKVGLYCSRPKVSNHSGYADVDWFREEKVK